jgi:signal transduction histidine kinase
MANAQQAPGQVAELAALRQCLSALDLSPAVRQRLDQALAESEGQLQQRLQQMTSQGQRWALLGDIAGKVVHEIRNPLNAIFLHADVIQGELQCPTLDSRAQMLDSLTDIRTEVRRLYEVMQDYLALARLAAILYEPEDMANFLRECGRLIQEQARSRGVSLDLQGLARLGAVALHQATLQRAFLNLLHRALDAMPQGGTLTLRGRRTDSYSVIEIHDTGSAILPEHRDDLFEPLQSTDSASTGLELYVVREIIAAHRGTIDVQSAPHQGTTFTVMLPLVRRPDRREGEVVVQ